VIEELYCFPFSNRIDIKDDDLVIGFLEEMSRQIQCHLRTCTVISANVEAIDPDIAVIKVFKADVGVDTALRVKSSSEEAGLMFVEAVFLPFKLRKILERERSCIIAKELSSRVYDAVLHSLSLVGDLSAIIDSSHVFDKNINLFLLAVLKDRGGLTYHRYTVGNSRGTSVTEEGSVPLIIDIHIGSVLILVRL